MAALKNGGPTNDHGSPRHRHGTTTDRARSARRVGHDGRGILRPRGVPIAANRLGRAGSGRLVARASRVKAFARSTRATFTAARLRIGLSGQMHGAVLLDARTARSQVVDHLGDQRTEAECRWIESTIGADRLLELTRTGAHQLHADQAAVGPRARTGDLGARGTCSRPRLRPLANERRACDRRCRRVGDADARRARRQCRRGADLVGIRADASCRACSESPDDTARAARIGGRARVALADRRRRR